jgi:hypothetical protein
MQEELYFDKLYNESVEIAIKISNKTKLVFNKNKRLDVINKQEIPKILPAFNKTLLAHNVNKKIYEDFIQEAENIKISITKENSEIEVLNYQQAQLKLKLKVYNTLFNISNINI